MYLFDHGTVCQSFLDCLRISAHQTSGSKESSPEISGNHTGNIIYIFSQDHIQHRPARCSGRFTIVAAPGKFPVHSYRINVTVVGGIPVFFFHFFNKSKCILFALYKAYSGNKPRFFFNDLSFAAFKNRFIPLQHAVSLLTPVSETLDYRFYCISGYNENDCSYFTFSTYFLSILSNNYPNGKFTFGRHKAADSYNPWDTWIGMKM